MRILVTNDDGISAPGLAVAEEIAAELAGPDGEVWVVAPAFEQSGVAHCVSYVRPMRLEPLGPRRFAVEGSPADCVLAGIHEILKDGPPDLVISGVNRGHNVAEDTLYSGTVGGAMEGALHGLRAVALSQYHGPATLRAPTPSPPPAPTARRSSAGSSTPRPGAAPPTRVFYNVNFPAGRRRRRSAAPAPPSRATAAPRPSASCRTSRRTAAPSSGSPTATATPTRRQAPTRASATTATSPSRRWSPTSRRTTSSRRLRRRSVKARLAHASRRTADAVRLHPPLARRDQRRRC